MITNLRTLGATLMFCLMGCANHTSSAMHERCAAFHNSFFSSSSEDREMLFDLANPEVQLQLVFCGNQTVHPGAKYLYDRIAQEGPSIVPLLTRELSLPQSSANVLDIVSIFNELQLQGQFDIAQDEPLIRLLSEKIDQMDDDFSRQLAQRRLKRLTEKH